MSDAKTLADTPQSASGSASGSTLDQILKGQRVRVRSVSGDDAVARRLGELGVRKGIEIEVIQRAPLRDPTLFELCGYQLCLRRSESARIQVEPLAETLSSRPADSSVRASDPDSDASTTSIAARVSGTEA